MMLLLFEIIYRWYYNWVSEWLIIFLSNELLPLEMFVLMIICCRGMFWQHFPVKIPPVDLSQGDPGEPLFLTPYIEKGDIKHGTFDTLWITA